MLFGNKVTNMLIRWILVDFAGE